MLVRLRGLLGDFELHPRSLAPIGAPLPEIDHSLITRMLWSALAELPEYRLRSLLDDTEDSEHRLDHRGLIDRLAWKIARGDLILVREVHGTATPDVLDGPDEPYDDDDIVERLTWIEVLVEDEDQQPIANVAFKLTLPDGAVRTGRTNRAGIARVEQIPEGECTLELTEFDAEAWQVV
ncbi:MAG TPA: hypothetical protein VK034_16285 [Enhygromyxa sp.]|nr:hypothetical protein [Enhygromyxa sp.]